MPRVPTYDNLTVAPQAGTGGPFQAASIADAGGQQRAQLGQAVQQTGAAITRLETDALQEANTTKVNDALNKAEARRQFYTLDKDQGFVWLKGDAALTRPDGKSLQQEVDEKYKADLDEIGKSLGNNAQRQMFDERATAMRTRLGGEVARHAGGEYQTYRTSVASGTIDTARNEMQTAWGDPEALRSATLRVQAGVYELGRTQGWSAQQVQAATALELGKAHSLVIDSMLESNKTAPAREYFAANADNMDAASRLRVEKVLKTSEEVEKRQTAVDKLHASGLDLQGGLDYIREHYTGIDRDHIESGWLADQQRKEAAATLRTRELTKPVQVALGDAEVNRRVITTSEQRDMLHDIKLRAPEAYDDWAGKIASHNRQIITQNRADADHMRAMANASTGDKAANELAIRLDMVKNPERYRGDVFADELPGMVKNGKLTPQSAEQLTGLWAQIRQNKGEANVSWLKLQDDELEAAAWKSGIMPRGTKFEKASADQQQAYMSFRDAVSARVNDFEQTSLSGKRKATQQEIRQQTDAYLMDKVFVPSEPWYGFTERLGDAKRIDQVKPEDLPHAIVMVGDKRVKLADIPPDVRTEASRALVKRGRPVTQQAIAEMYLWQQQQPKGGQ